ncbi:MAG: tyrosine-type recombinase/integrase, partial [Candidatus Limnocylindria bacterium]
MQRLGRVNTGYCTGCGRPPAGYFTKRTAEEWLRGVLDEARRGTLAGMVRTGATFADAAAEFLRYAERDRTIKPSTLVGYRSIISAHLLPAFGDRPLEQITTGEIERWRARLVAIENGRELSNATKNRIVVLMHGIFRRAVKVWGLPVNPVSGVERHPVRAGGDIEVFAPEEVMALVRAANTPQDGALFLTAAFTGLRRGELLALRWR